MLVFTTVLGYVLKDNQKLLDSIVDSALAQLPFVGQQIQSDPSKIQGHGLVLAIGLLVSLWAGMKAFVAVHGALDDIDEMPLDDRSNLFITRLRALFGILYVGGASWRAILASLATVADIAAVSSVLLTLGTVAINAGVLALSYRWLRTKSPAWRDLAPEQSSAACCSPSCSCWAWRSSVEPSPGHHPCTGTSPPSSGCSRGSACTPSSPCSQQR
jgi:uncharacterized BrkB/YihY/UPF0761 family membrane protein